MHLLEIVAPLEADFGIEVLLDYQVARGQSVAVAVVVEVAHVAPVLIGQARAFGFGEISVDGIVVEKVEGTVDAIELIRAVACQGIRAVGEHDADGAAAENVLLEAQNRKARRFDAGQVAAVGIDVERADIDIADFSRQAGACVDGKDLAPFEPDAAAEEHRRDVEIAGLDEVEISPAFEKEIAFFREEEIETRQVDLAFVDLDLGEIGVIGEIGGEIVGDAEFHIHPVLLFGLVVDGRRRPPVRRQRAEPVGLDFEIEVARRRLEFFQIAGLGDAPHARGQAVAQGG